MASLFYSVVVVIEKVSVLTVLFLTLEMYCPSLQKVVNLRRIFNLSLIISGNSILMDTPPLKYSVCCGRNETHNIQ